MPETFIELRPIGDADLPFLKTLFGVCRPELAALPLPEQQARALLDMQYQLQYDAYRQCEGIEFLLILRQGEPIGRLTWQRSPARRALVDIGLLPAWRQRGIGAAVLGRFLREAAMACQTVHLHVARGNPAQRLYARLGFETSGDDGAFLRMEKRVAQPC